MFLDLDFRVLDFRYGKVLWVLGNWLPKRRWPGWSMFNFSTEFKVDEQMVYYFYIDKRGPCERGYPLRHTR